MRRRPFLLFGNDDTREASVLTLKYGSRLTFACGLRHVRIARVVGLSRISQARRCSSAWPESGVLRPAAGQDTAALGITPGARERERRARVPEIPRSIGSYRLRRCGPRPDPTSCWPSIFPAYRALY